MPGRRSILARAESRMESRGWVLAFTAEDSRRHPGSSPAVRGPSSGRRWAAGRAKALAEAGILSLAGAARGVTDEPSKWSPRRTG